MPSNIFVANDNNVVLQGYQLSATGVAVTDALPTFTVYEDPGPTGAFPPVTAVPGLSNLPMSYVSGAGYVGMIPGTAQLTPGSRYYIVVTVSNYNDRFADWFTAASHTSS